MEGREGVSKLRTVSHTFTVPSLDPVTNRFDGSAPSSCAGSHEMLDTNLV